MRVRIFYSKCGDLIYTSNLDVQKIWERSARRAGLSLSYSSGFHPQARIQQACPLPLGFYSKEEIVDIWFERQHAIRTLAKKLGSALPSGIEIISIKEIDMKSSAMQNLVTLADYEVTISEKLSLCEVKNKINHILQSDNFPFERRGKSINLRQRIESIEVLSPKNVKSITLHMKLKHIPSANGRPDDVLHALGFDPLEAKIMRTKIYYQLQKA